MAAKTPDDCDALFERHLNAGDLDSLVDLYEQDAVLVPNPGESAVGRESIREALGGLVAAKGEIQLRVAQVLRAGDDLAMLYGDWTGHFTDPDGARVAIAGQSIEGVRRQSDGTWRFALADPSARGGRASEGRRLRLHGGARPRRSEAGFRRARRGRVTVAKTARQSEQRPAVLRVAAEVLAVHRLGFDRPSGFQQ